MGGRVRGGEFWVFGLQGAEFGNQEVVVGVGDLRGVVGVVAVEVVGDQRPQLGGAVGRSSCRRAGRGIRGGHGPSLSAVPGPARKAQAALACGT